MSQNPCRKGWLLASLFLVGLLPAVLAAPPPADPTGLAVSAGVAFVKADATGANDGTNWQDAYTDLQDALTAAWNSAGTISQIWVATGTYKPPIGQDFDLPPGVALYGGFVGYEDDPGQRDPNARSILKGNGSRVIYIGSESVALDGFAIEDGSEYDGGGIYCINSNLIIRNCSLAHNGGGILCGHSSLKISNCMFRQNTGRAVYIFNSVSSPTITDSTFEQNTSREGGGGIYCDYSNPVIRNCSFAYNLAHGFGGAVWCGWYGGISATITNCEFRQNTAGGYGGALFLGSDSGSTIMDCTFEQNSANLGGALALLGRDSPQVSRCLFTGNQALYGGGAILNSCISARFSQCQIRNNALVEGGDTPPGGGGICTDGGQFTDCIIANNTSCVAGGGIVANGGTFSACSITGNSATFGGGGVHAERFTSVVLRDCLITGNSAGRAGGGVDSWNDQNGILTITGCTIADNSAPQAGGLYTFKASANLDNCIVWANGTNPIGSYTGALASITFSDIQGGFLGEGNIDADPMLTADYHLTRGSPCINAGDPAYASSPDETDIDGQPRIVAGRADIGCDEFCYPGDINADGCVNITDLLLLVPAWGSTDATTPPSSNWNASADCNGDGYVNVGDLQMLVANWGKS